MNAQRFVSSADIAIKLGMIGATAAYRSGVARQRVREATLQNRVNQYAAAVLLTRVDVLKASKNAGRDAVAASVLSTFDGHR